MYILVEGGKVIVTYNIVEKNPIFCSFTNKNHVTTSFQLKPKGYSLSIVFTHNATTCTLISRIVGQRQLRFILQSLRLLVIFRT